MLKTPDCPGCTTDPGRLALETRQFARLQALWRAIVPANPFQTARLARAGLTAAPATLEDFVRRVPFTTKQDLVADQLARPPFGSNLTYPLARYTRFSQTSGTTAAPLRWLDTPESWDWMLDNWAAVFAAAGVTAADRLYFAFSFGPFLGFWTAFDAATRLGCLCLPGGGLTSAARLRAILDNQATVLCCTPTYALRLGEVAREEGIDLAAARIRTLIVAGEAGGAIPATRQRLEAIFPGARAVDHHGMTEVGPVSFGCPARPGVLHILEDAYVAEIINPATGTPVCPGGLGELVLTPLGRVGAPVLRYRTGDLVRRTPAPVCTCGRCEIGLEGGILGRADDMVVIRGVNVFPSAIEDVLRRYSEVAEYRVEVKRNRGHPELRVLVEPTGEAGPSDLAGRLESALRAALHLRIPVTLAPTGTLPRFEMKASRWLRP